MKFVNELVVLIHLLGMAAIVGAYLATRGQGRLPMAMLWGARAQVLTGLVLAGIAEMDKDEPPNHMKIGVKLLVALAVLACVEVSNARQRKAVGAAGSSASASPQATVAGAGGLVDLAFWLAVLNVAIAVLWRSYS